MSRYSRFWVFGFATLLAGTWSFSAAAQVPQYIERFIRDKGACWKELGTGFTYTNTPTDQAEMIADLALDRGDFLISPDRSQIFVHVGAGSIHYVVVPCPPPPPLPPLVRVVSISFTGASFSLSVIKTRASLEWVERLAATNEETNRDSVAGDPVGGGVSLGYAFRWPGANLVIDPFFSFDFPNTKANFFFPNGSFIGAKNNYEGTFGVKVGPSFDQLWIYAVAGVSFLNEKLTVNFIPVSSSTTTTVPGATFGLGFAVQPTWLQGFGLPTSLSVEYQHSFWQTAKFNTPASSPLFNYDFKREDDKFLVGLNFFFSAPPVGAEPTYPVKARVSK